MPKIVVTVLAIIGIVVSTIFLTLTTIEAHNNCRTFDCLLEKYGFKLGILLMLDGMSLITLALNT